MLKNQYTCIKLAFNFTFVFSIIFFNCAYGITSQYYLAPPSAQLIDFGFTVPDNEPQAGFLDRFTLDPFLNSVLTEEILNTRSETVQKMAQEIISTYYYQKNFGIPSLGLSSEDEQFALNELSHDIVLPMMAQLDIIAKRIKMGDLEKQAVELYLSDQEVVATKSKAGAKVSFFPWKGDPETFGHLWFKLEQLTRFDFLVPMQDNGDPRKPRLTSLMMRRAFTDPLARQLEGYMENIEIQYEREPLLRAIGESVFFEMLYENIKRNEGMIDVVWVYNAGSDHANYEVKIINDATGEEQVSPDVVRRIIDNKIMLESKLVNDNILSEGRHLKVELLFSVRKSDLLEFEGIQEADLPRNDWVERNRIFRGIYEKYTAKKYDELKDYLSGTGISVNFVLQPLSISSTEIRVQHRYYKVPITMQKIIAELQIYGYAIDRGSEKQQKIAKDVIDIIKYRLKNPSVRDGDLQSHIGYLSGEGTNIVDKFLLQILYDSEQTDKYILTTKEDLFNNIYEIRMMLKENILKIAYSAADSNNLNNPTETAEAMGIAVSSNEKAIRYLKPPELSSM